MATLKVRLFSTAVVVVAVGLTTAIGSVFGEEHQVRFFGPTGRQQQRQTEQPAPLNSSRQVEPSSTDVSTNRQQAILLAEKWRASLLSLVETQTPAEVTELPEPDGEFELLIVPDTERDAATTDQPIETRCLETAPMSSLSVNIALPEGALPTDVAALCASTTMPVGDRRMEGGWAMTDYRWSATCLCHRPLYFEEVNAERYGYTPSYLLQPLFSACNFFLTIPALPYKMALDCPRDCVYTLGHYRPGSCVPRRWHCLPLKAGAAVAQVGVVAGLIILIP